MKIRQVLIDNEPCIQIASSAGWVNASAIVKQQPQLQSVASSVLNILSASPNERETLAEIAKTMVADNREVDSYLLPFQPLSYRDFMLYERHVIDSSRGFAKRFLPKVFPITKIFEKITGKPFPAFKPKPLWYKQPIYYIGNHLAFIPQGATIPYPDYCTALDYELELGFVLSKPLFNATPQEAEAAIGGFMVFNDVSVRNVQMAEMGSGFGPQKAKHFCNVLGCEVVTADEVLPIWQTLTGEVKINGKKVSEVSTQKPQFTLGEALAHVSRSERLFAGEFFGTGTLPGGCGMENGFLPQHNDQLELIIHGIGSVSNPISSTKS
jgi:2-keto-4-pentenoate hydratase/2-oxohepta-3-ene-1,7-dioic acid hydratase in catechol pathway